MASHRGHRLRLEDISHRFGEFVAVRDINLDVAGGELVALLGPSGCGKSTLLRIVSGFIRQTSGRVLFDAEPVDHLPPSRRGAGIVFQNYALFPHMTVAENVAYGLEAQKWPRQRIVERVAEMLALVHMSEFAARKPRQLSGGQQQRTAMARCLATDPKVLLLDEPFGALDKNLRLDMQIEVKRLQREYGIATIRVPGGAVLRAKPTPHLLSGAAVLVSVRPEHLRLEAAAGEGRIAGVVKAVMPLGPHVVYEVETQDGASLKVSEPRAPATPLRRAGESVHVAAASEAACRIFASE